MLLAIDPGPTESAWVAYNGTSVAYLKGDNERLLALMLENGLPGQAQHVALEMVESFGMPVGREVFETCYWVGRFAQAASPIPHTLVYRSEVKMHLCSSRRAKDSNIRQALIDRFGPGKGTAIGTKAHPGALYGISGDCWSALAVAVTWYDRYVVAESWPAAAAVQPCGEA